MIALDTSVAVPAALPAHVAHAAVRSALPSARTPAIAHVLVETYSVLTRMPAPQRVPAEVAWEYLRKMFLLPPLLLEASSYSTVLDQAATEGIVGGAVYDAVVAATAAQAGATLLTRDRRAITTYRRVGVSHRLIG